MLVCVLQVSLSEVKLLNGLDSVLRFCTIPAMLEKVDKHILNKIRLILKDRQDGIYIVMATVHPLAFRNRIEFIARYVCSLPQVINLGKADNESQNSAHFCAREWYCTIQHTVLL